MLRRFIQKIQRRFGTIVIKYVFPMQGTVSYFNMESPIFCDGQYFAVDRSPVKRQKRESLDAEKWSSIISYTIYHISEYNF